MYTTIQFNNSMKFTIFKYNYKVIEILKLNSDQ